LSIFFKTLGHTAERDADNSDTEEEEHHQPTFGTAEMDDEQEKVGEEQAEMDARATSNHAGDWNNLLQIKIGTGKRR
jgi:hypothetical protein